MKKWFTCYLLYSDTDSLTYEIENEEVYKELAKEEIKNDFDFSNYPPDSELFDKKITW